MGERQARENPRVEIVAAAWIAPMSGPIIRDGAIAHSDGRILGLGPRSEIGRQFAGARVEDLDHAILLPGLVNPHVHLELSALSPTSFVAGLGEASGPGSSTPATEPAANPSARFVEWIKRLMQSTPREPQALRAFVEAGVREGIRQCLAYGVTTVGDISRHSQITRPMLRNGPMRVTSFGEVTAMAQRRGALEERLAQTADRSAESEFLRVGISPHAPYSVEPHGYRRCHEVADEQAMLLTTHLAESPDEGIFLSDHAGPFRQLWDWLGAWDDATPRFAGGPIRLAAALGLLRQNTLLAHVNYCDDAEIAILAGGRASMIYCPRTHAYFGHPPHRWREMLAAGINVALGTDSCASSPNLNLVEDLRLVAQLAPDLPTEEIWKLGTIRAAHALNRETEVGSIEVGKAADFVAFRAQGDDPLKEILDLHCLPTGVWIAGQRCFGNP